MSDGLTSYTYWSSVQGGARRVILAAALAVTGVGASLAPALPTAAQSATATFTTSAAVPQDALAYMNVPLDEESAQWTMATELFDRAGFGQQLQDARDEALDGVPLDALLGGEVAIVLTNGLLEAAASAAAESDDSLSGIDATPVAGLSGPDEVQGFAVVLDARAPDTAFAGIEGAIQDQADEAGVETQTSEYQGVTITYAPAAGDDYGSMGFAAAQVDDLVLMATTPADLEALIDAAQGTVPSIDDLDGFSTVRGELPAEFLMFGFFNGSAVDAGSTDTADQLAQLGLDPSLATLRASQYSGFTIAADAVGFRMETVAMNIDGSAIPAGPANFESSIAGRAPADAIFFASAADLSRAGASGPDQPGLLEVIGASAIAFGMSGMGGGMDDGSTSTTSGTASEWVSEQYAGLASLLGINLQTDFIQQLTGEYGIWVSAGNGDPSAISALFASGVADESTVANVLTTLNSLAASGGETDSGITTRTVDGGTVNVIETGPGAPQIEYGVVDGNLLFAVGAAIDRHTGDATDSLATSEQYESVLATLPAEHNGIIYLDLAQLLPITQSLSSDTSGMMSSSGEEMPDADASCADYATQDEAQAAYDEFLPGTEMLDSDFDGTVCEDFFNPAAASDENSDQDEMAAEAADAYQSLDLSAIKAFALVGYDEDGMRKSSSIVVIGN